MVLGPEVRPKNLLGAKWGLHKLAQRKLSKEFAVLNLEIDCSLGEFECNIQSFSWKPPGESVGCLVAKKGGNKLVQDLAG
jgi:hypothetical protein